MLNLDFGNLVMGFVGAVSTALVGYFTVVRKARNDEAAIVLAAWKDLLDPLQEELRGAKEEIRLLKEHLAMTEAAHRRENEKLLAKIRELKKQIEEK